MTSHCFNIEIKCVKTVIHFFMGKKIDDSKSLFYFNMTFCALFFGVGTLNEKHFLKSSGSLILGLKILKFLPLKLLSYLKE